METEYYKNKIRKQNDKTTFDEFVYIVANFIRFTSWLAIIIVLNYKSLSDVMICGCIGYIVLGLFSFYYVYKVDRYDRKNDLYMGYLRELEDFEKNLNWKNDEANNNKKISVLTKMNADRYYKEKKEAADKLARVYIDDAHKKIDQEREDKKAKIDEYTKQKKQEIEEAREQKKRDIDEYKQAALEEIDEYREEKDEEILEWINSSETLENIRRSELEYYHDKYGIDDPRVLMALLKRQMPFAYSATMIADVKAALFETEEKLLRFKEQPAVVASEKVAEVKKKFRETCSEYKQMRYKYEFLLSVFPELTIYVEDEKGIMSLADASSYSDFTENYDRVRDYLSEDEYNSLSKTQRNQLALDNYNKRPKSNWQIGVEYEMYCAYLLRERGFKTIDYGIRMRLEDLGRDIIAKKNGVTYIIQCKRWSADRIIHENVICQLFGTTIEYNIRTQEENQNPTLFDDDFEVIPVLMTTAELSETAKVFAEKLKVKIEIVQMGKYPQIKCNINQGNKIYHLPFDQQYYTTKIEKEGETYAWTVEEAERMQFRRAFRWGGNN